MQRLIAATLPAVVLLAVSTAPAATVTVPGDETTISDAVTTAAPGDTILVDPGTYAENVLLNKNLTLLSTGGRAATTIQGISSVGALGTVQVTTGSNGVRIGAAGQGFTILGIDNGNPGIENAAIYFQGAHSNAVIEDNEIVAQGDHGLLTEYGAAITGFVITGNEFSGSTFFDPPSGDGFGDQFTQPNRPRQLVTMGCGGGCVSTTNITFTNNVISGTAGGINVSLNEQGNTLVTIDATNAVITGNQFLGTTTRFATSLRARGPACTISGNTFSSAGLTPTTGHVYVQNSGQMTGAVALANTFDKGVYVDAAVGTIGFVIQNAVLAVPGGTTIDVLPGTYTEQVVIDGKNLTLRGSGKAVTTIAAPAILATTFTTPANNRPVVTAANASDVVIRDFTIDGMGVGNANNRFEGVAFWEAGGALLDCDVVRIRDNPASGVQHGVGVYAFNLSGGPFSLEVGGCTVTDYQKNAMALSGVGLTVDVHDCTTIGAGDIAYTAQNGIQVSFGAGGSVADCSVSNMRYTPASTVASGLLMYQGTSVDVSNVALVDAQEAVYYTDTSGSIDGVSVSFAVSQPDYDGVAVNNATALARADDGRPVPAPLEEQYTPARGLRAPITVNLSNGCLTGTGGVGTTGIWAGSASSPLDVNVSNMKVTNWGYGVVAAGASVSLDVTHSSIAGNVVRGYDNTGSGAAQDAAFNWWGAANGPSGDGGGSGDAVASVGGEVTFTPYLTSGASSTLCAFTPTGNLVEPNPGVVCVSTATPCVTVPVDITRTDTAGMRGFSVTFTLSPELKLCSGLGSVMQGTYLSSLPALTVFQVVPNGGNSYTADGSILGLPCGQMAPAGTLFTIGVADSLGVPGTGTITINSVILRDCANAPIPATPGAAALITVDGAPPAAMANVAAAQDKSGNTAGNDTTGVTLTFTAPGDAAVVEVWAAPYGNYPEYDDAPGAGSVPTSPGSYPPGSPWQLTGVTASGQNAYLADRDFWYFVAYSKDACGNVSAVSNMTGGTLNYHLGDVSDGVTPGHGDNLVDIADMSHLGASYGITLGVSDSLAYLDVGRTDDFSVDTRPLTDNKVDFEDLMMFAINYGQVSRTTPIASGEAVLEDPRLVMAIESAGDRVLARLSLDDHGDLVQGIHAQVTWDAAALELAGVTRGGLADGGAFLGTIPSDGSVAVDLARLGQGATFHGNGEVAVLEFRRIAGSATPVLAEAALRDAHNRPATRRPAAGSTEPTVVTAAPEVTHVQLLGARPNPFAQSTDIRFALPAASAVTVRIHDVGGRLVRTLVDGPLAAGQHTARWDGRTDSGDRAGSGIYFYSFRAGDVRETRKLVYTR